MRTLDWPRFRYVAEPIAVLPVTDGDTIKTTLSYGDDLYRRRNLRLYGVDACEMNRLHDEAEAEAARAFVIKALASGPSTLYVRTFRDAKSFDRLVARINLDRGGELVSLAALLADENERRVAAGARPFARVIAPDYREIGG